MSNSAILKSSLAKKYWMAFTGLFLCLFLVGHLAGNLQLFIQGEPGRLQFNAYAAFMTTNPLVKILSYVTYISILFHAIDGIILTRNNMRARPSRYVQSNPSANSHWTSRNMGILGTIILVFIIIHMRTFWYEMHWGEIGLDIEGNRDLYSVVMATFSDPSFGIVYTIGYALAMMGVAFHLVHGFQAAFQSLGLKTRKIENAIRLFGLFFAIVVPTLFAAIPIYIFLTQ